MVTMQKALQCMLCIIVVAEHMAVEPEMAEDLGIQTAEEALLYYEVAIKMPLALDARTEQHEQIKVVLTEVPVTTAPELYDWLQTLPFTPRTYDLFGMGNLCYLRIMRVEDEQVRLLAEYLVDGSKTRLYQNDRKFIADCDKTAAIYAFIDQYYPLLCN